MSSPDTLLIARKTLQTEHIPFLLRVTYYLRISCNRLAGEGIRYSELLKALFQCNPNWLMTCEVTPSGELKSDDPEIHQLLMPIEQLHRAIPSKKELLSPESTFESCPLESSPIAA